MNSRFNNISVALRCRHAQAISVSRPPGPLLIRVVTCHAPATYAEVHTSVAGSAVSSRAPETSHGGGTWRLQQSQNPCRRPTWSWRASWSRSSPWRRRWRRTRGATRFGLFARRTSRSRCCASAALSACVPVDHCLLGCVEDNVRRPTAFIAICMASDLRVAELGRLPGTACVVVVVACAFACALMLLLLLRMLCLLLCRCVGPSMAFAVQCHPGLRVIAGLPRRTQHASKSLDMEGSTSRTPG